MGDIFPINPEFKPTIDEGSSEHLCQAIIDHYDRGESLALTDWAGDY